ncbi:hypothetical protein [Paracidovorax wautersii]|uniref:hypothetical protein n=1 Tax=Paracidovorax wautersii TaxID=1177982 RepID=UPI0031DFABC0
MTTTATTGAEMPTNEQICDILQIGNPTDEECRLIRLGYAAALSAAAPAAPADPMDWPLPCDVTVGHGTIGKGVPLRTLVNRMKVLYGMATGNDADEVQNRTPEQRQALTDAFIASVQPAATPKDQQPGAAEVDGRVTADMLSTLQSGLSMLRQINAESEERHARWEDHQPDLAEVAPIDMVLNCPACGLQHIDADEWEDNPHDIEQGRILERSSTPSGIPDAAGHWVRYEDHVAALSAAAPAAPVEHEPSPTAGMSLAQRILHVGGRNNAAGYVEFGSTQAVEALIRHVLRDLPATAAPQAQQPTAPQATAQEGGAA